MPAMTAPQIDIAQLRAYSDKLLTQRQDIEESSNQLLSQLINKVDELGKLYEIEHLDRLREQEISRDLQKKNIRLQDEIDRTKRVDRDTSVLVLIDGDGLLFQDRYIRDGEEGGHEAAQELYNQISRHIQTFKLSPDVKILVRVYANATGLARTYADAGIADFNVASAFTRGFTKARAHFDFVDCGAGKERADKKIGASFNLYINNYQTSHIILGVSHDNGYARILEELSDDASNKVTLLEGVPFAQELYRIKHRFTEARFTGLFRETKIELGAKSVSEASPSFTIPLLANSNNNNNNVNGPRSHSPERSHSSTSTVAENGASRSSYPSGATPTSNTAAGQNSWAGRASTPTPPGFTLVQHSSNSNNGTASGVKQIRRNRKGQRLDPSKPAAVDRDLVDRIQQMRLCNNKNLKGECRSGAGLCAHNHQYKPSRLELEALRYIARRIPCVNETACDDVNCTAGHHCPWINDGQCYYQNRGKCKFSNEMHYDDLREVKTTVVR